jgi:MraZ protein
MHFFGNTSAKLDAKNRVFIPVAYRKQLQKAECETLYLRKDMYRNCITVYPEDVWNEELKRVKSKLNRYEEGHMDLLRQFLQETQEVTLDGSGRMLIPRQFVLLFAGELEVRFLGVDDTFELWPASALDKPLLEPDAFAQKMRQLMTGSTH